MEPIKISYQSFCASPGCEIKTSLRVIEKNENFEIWIDSDELREEVMVGSTPQTNDWRDVATIIGHLDEGFLSIDEWSRDDFSITGDTTFRGEIYALAWVVESEGDTIRPCDISNLLQEFTDEQLINMHRQSGSFLNNEFTERLSSILETVDEHNDLSSTKPPLPSKIAFTQEAPILEQYESAITSWAESEISKRSAALEPFASEISQLCTTYRDILGKPSGYASAISKEMAMGRFRRFVEDHIVNYGSTPKGEIAPNRIGEHKIV